MIKVINGNSIEELKKFPDNYFGSVVTDPPYGLSFMGKKWDYDVPSVELWKEVFRVLKEGGHLLAFAGTRTQHRMAVNIEDAGFEIRDMIAWVYGSGFPKSHNIGKAIDKNGGNNNLVNEISVQLKKAREKRNISLKKADEMFCNGTTNYSWYEGRPQGQRLPDDKTFEKIANEWEELKELSDLVKQAERKVIGKQTNIANKGNENTGRYQWNTKGQKRKETINITIPSTEQAKQWEGWGTALKPALEPITMARKPFKTSVAENVLKNGVGGINIDGCRVGSETIKGQKAGQGFNNVKGFGVNTKKGNEKAKEYISEDIKGRFPANFIHDGSDEVKDLFPDSESKGNRKGIIKDVKSRSWKNKSIKGIANTDYNDKGNASRFFYCAKTSKQDRNEGLEDFEDKKSQLNSGGIGRKISVKKKLEKNGNNTPTTKNIHPTVKPTDLMRYLVRLVTPKNEIVLDCFMGSGSTGKACALEGLSFVGIDLDKDYCKIAKARIDKALEDKRIMDSQIKLF